MKTFIISTAIALSNLIFIYTGAAHAQNTIQSHVVLQDMDGRLLPADEVILNREKVMVVFWNSGNPKHLEYLDALNEEYDRSYGADHPVILAVSTDKYHSPQKLRTLVASKHWNFDVFVDVNQNLSRMYAVCDEQLQAYTFLEGKKKAVEIQRPELLPNDFLAEVITGTGN